jgi:hypothetical protein
VALSALIVGCSRPAPENHAAAESAPPAASRGGGGGLPDGVYDCSEGAQALGKVDIQGATFRFRPADVPGGVFAPYSVNAAGQIHWGGAFRVIEDPPARLTTSTRLATGFNVGIQATPEGAEATMVCAGPAKSA